MEGDYQDDTSASLIVWLIDDCEHYRSYVHNAVQQTGGRIRLIEFTTCESALESLHKQTAPDIILLDLSLPQGMGGIEGLARFVKHSPQSRIIIVTNSEEDHDIFEAFCRGAVGYVVKTSVSGKILEAINDAMEGRSFIDSHVANKILHMHSISSDLNKKYNLTSTEIKILDLIRIGYTRKHVMNHLCIAETTLKYHLQNIYSKLQVHSLTEAVTKSFPFKEP